MADVNDGLAAGTSEAMAIADMTPDEARAELAKREAQKLTRRAALAKMGVRGAMAIFAAFSVDDLARMVAKKMEQRAGENAAVDEVARQLHNAGVSFAAVRPACIVMVDENDIQRCVGSGCLKDMPVCGCACGTSTGSRCQECCVRCPVGDYPSTGPRARCEAACAGVAD